MQFVYYTGSILDGSLGYSFKKEAVVSELIRDRIGATLQISLPAVVISTLLGLVSGLIAGYRKNGLFDRLSTGIMLVLNTVPSFLTALTLIILFCFKVRLFPYTGLSGRGMQPGMEGFLADRIHHLVLPVLTIIISVLPSRYILMRNTTSSVMEQKYVLYAKERGLSPAKIRWSYILKNIAQPFVTMVGMSVGLCVGGSLIVENIFSVNGMGKLLTDAVYTLDYPLMQGILFVTTAIMTLSIILTDLVCLLIDPHILRGNDHAET